MLDWMKHTLESRFPGEISITNDIDLLFIITNDIMTNDTTLTAESKEELKSLFMKVKEENEKTGLKLKIRKAQIMASSPITSGK